jgi:hypothetical protein
MISFSLDDRLILHFFVGLHDPCKGDVELQELAKYAVFLLENAYEKWVFW